MALCALTGRSLEIDRIRANRRKLGLAAQHLTGVKAVARICGGTLEGAEIGSQRLRFQPGPIAGGSYRFDVSEVRASAGSSGMLFQTVLPVLAFAGAPSELVLKGGTHTKWAPPIHFLKEVLLPTLKSTGLDTGLDVETWGWYPQGGGVCRATIQPVDALEPVHLTGRPVLEHVDLLSVVSNLPVSIARRQQDRARKRLEDAGIPLRIETTKAPSPGKGTFVFLLAHYGAHRAGFSALGELGKPAETVADEAVDAFLAHHGSEGPVDPYLADQMVIFLALARGRSTFATSQVTPHLVTVAEVAGEITGAEIKIEGEAGEPGRVEIDGVGLERRRSIED
jgi:RNA 3'-terminal phosphate cyclase (ATP)